MKVGSLFSGIGGFDLAAERLGMEVSWYSEIEPYASAVMKKHFPQAVNLGDVTSIDGTQIEKVDIITGGFPCQDISFAGRGAGLAGERSGLWSHFARLIGEVNPKYALIENVAALRSRGLGTVLGDLMALGYDAEWHCIPASYVGAPHQRDRIWIVAYSSCKSNTQEGSSACTIRRGRLAWSNDCGSDGSAIPRNDWWLSEPDVGRVVDGVPSRVDRLRTLGNALVPQVAELILGAIQDRERRIAEGRPLPLSIIGEITA